jgi:hypothetical protein
MKVIPQSAALYRAAVRDLNSTLHDPTERAEARALIAELLGRQVRIRQDGAAVFARLEIDEAVLLASAAKSLEIKDFQVGSGGRISRPSTVVQFRLGPPPETAKDTPRRRRAA